MPVTNLARPYYVDTTAVILSTGILGITQEARRTLEYDHNYYIDPSPSYMRRG